MTSSPNDDLVRCSHDDGCGELSPRPRWRGRAPARQRCVTRAISGDVDWPRVLMSRGARISGPSTASRHRSTTPCVPYSGSAALFAVSTRTMSIYPELAGVPGRMVNPCRRWLSLSTTITGPVWFRGLLCPPCNAGLGAFGDDPTRLMAAAVYASLTASYEEERSHLPPPLVDLVDFLTGEVVVPSDERPAQGVDPRNRVWATGLRVDVLEAARG